MSAIKAGVHKDEPVTEDTMRRAIATASARKSKATSVRFLPLRRSLLISFSDLSSVEIPIVGYSEFEELMPDELHRITVGFGGRALCLEERDLHVSVAGLISELTQGNFSRPEALDTAPRRRG